MPVRDFSPIAHASVETPPILANLREDRVVPWRLTATLFAEHLKELARRSSRRTRPARLASDGLGELSKIPERRSHMCLSGTASMIVWFSMLMK